MHLHFLEALATHNRLYWDMIPEEIVHLLKPAFIFETKKVTNHETVQKF